MKDNTYKLIALVLTLMTAASVGFMIRTLGMAREYNRAMENAAIEQLISPMNELTEHEAFFSLVEPVTVPAEDQYMLGLHDGYITVFLGADGRSGIKEVTSTPASALPREEWVRLATGIHINNDEELVMRLQDYGS